MRTAAPAAVTVGGLVLSPLAVGLSALRGVFRRPSVLVAATVVLVCVPLRGPALPQLGASLADIGSGVLVVVVAVRAFALGERPLSRPAAGLLAAVLLALAVATVTSHDPAASAIGLARYVQLFVLVPAAVVAAMRDRRDIAIVAGTLLSVAVVQGAIGVWQYVTGNGAAFDGEPIRAIGTFGAVNIMGLAIVVSYGVLLALGLALPMRGWPRVVLVLTALALLVPLAFSLSRGSWIATVVAAAVVLLVHSPRLALVTGLTAVAGGVVLVGGFGVGAEALAERVSSIGSVFSDPGQSVTDRYDLWSTAFGMWTDHPVTGVGLQQFPEFRDSYAPLRLSSGSDVVDPVTGYQQVPLRSPHSLYFLVLAEQGLLGLLALLALLGTLAVATVRRAVRATSPGTRAIGLAVTGLLCWQLVNFSYADLGGPTSVLLAIVLGLATAWALPARGGTRCPVPPRAAEGDRAAAVAGEEGRTQIPSTAVTTRIWPVSGAAEGRVDPPRRRRPLFRATVISAVLIVLGSVLGLARDLLLARYFGASAATDAYLVAWLIPETASPLLIEDAMAFLLVPAFTTALLHGRDAVRALVARTLPWACAGLIVLSVACAVASPVLVRVLAPGLSNPELAVVCMRITSLATLGIGLTGYLAATLRAHGVFGPPAAIYVLNNIGIIALMVLLHDEIGVISAAIGVAVGSLLMVAVQVPSAARRIGTLRPPRSPSTTLSLGAFAPIAVYTLTRQAQVFVERFLASSLSPGAISYLNYAQKVAQVPVTLTLVVVLVTFPVLARHIARRDTAGARRRVEQDLHVVTLLVLLATAYVIALAPAIIDVLFQRGAFTAADTAATASVMRVYALGLLGQAFVGVLCRCFFSQRSTWYPARLMGYGLLATALAGAVGAVLWGAPGIAAANAVGITLTAALMLRGVDRTVLSLPVPQTAAMVARLLLPAIAAGIAGLGWAQLLGSAPALLVVISGGIVVLTVFAAVVAFTDRDGLRRLRAVAAKKEEQAV